MLSAKYGGAYSNLVVKTKQENAEKLEAASSVWLPKKQAWLAATKAFDKSMLAGQFVATDDGAALKKYGAVGSTSDVVTEVFDSEAGAVAFRKELKKDKHWGDTFECEILGATRTLVSVNSKTKEALKANGESKSTSPIDQLACELHDGGSPRVAIVVEVPVNDARAKVTVSGTQGTVTSYEVRHSVGLDPELAAALEGNRGESLAGRTIKVSGVSRLHRGESGSEGYKMLKDRNMTTRLAVKTAEYKKVWVASFERACADEGLGCKVDDGRPAPEVKLLPAPPEPESSATPPSPIGGGRRVPRGRWEAAALEAEPDLFNEQSYHDDPWGKGLFVSVVDKGARVEGFGALGNAVKTSPWSGEDHPKIAAFRDALQKKGGAEPFVCTVKEMGQEINPSPVELRSAALKAKGKESSESPTWIIVCQGDEKSHDGTVAVFVPTDAVWAILDGGKVKDYHLEPHGYFHKDLRDKLMDIGIGTRLEISGYPRVARSMLKNVIFRREWSFPVWRAYLGDYQCAHEGMGCPAQDGLKTEIKVAEGGLVPCPVSTFEYPPKG